MLNRNLPTSICGFATALAVSALLTQATQAQSLDANDAQVDAFITKLNATKSYQDELGLLPFKALENQGGEIKNFPPGARAPYPCKSGGETPPTIMINGAKLSGCQAQFETSHPVYAYAGIGYARPPIKELRWKPPVPIEPATGTYTSIGNICPQHYESGTFYGDEDCLYLNVWTSKAALDAPAPVMVFIHGGAFVGGAALSYTSRGALPYDGSSLADQGVVVVSLNYRLGALGFLNLAGGSESLPGWPAIRGNLGLLDQQTALKWVHTYISNFGGDPSRVTIFGESAGAMSVGLHTLVMPTSNDGTVFQQAIMESNPIGSPYPDTATAQAMGEEGFATVLKRSCKKDNQPCDSPDTTPTVEILKSQDAAIAGYCVKVKQCKEKYLSKGYLPWGPAVDGDLIMGQPSKGYVDGVQNHIPVMFGINKNEGPFFVALIAGKNDPLQMITDKYLEILINTTADNHFKCRPKVYDSSTLRDFVAELPTGSLNKTISYNNIGTAIANYTTDTAFACGNLGAANAMYAKDPQQALYGYYFAQTPYADTYHRNNDAKKVGLDNGACEPSGNLPEGETPNVCHGNELTYVFNTLDSASGPPGSPYTPTDDDRDLAKRINAAWVSFAKTGNPGNGWQRYEGPNSRLVTELCKGGNACSSTADLDRIANCTSFWFDADACQK